VESPQPPKAALAKIDIQTAAPAETLIFASTTEGNLCCIGYAEVTAYPIFLILAFNPPNAEASSA